MYKSDQLASRIKQFIEDGTWKPHTKLPSLREQVQLSGFSLITVMRAYQSLEAQGLIYSREKSGYYVSDLSPIKLDTKVTLNPKIEINSVVLKYLKSIQQSDIVPLGTGFLNHQLLYPAKLTRIMTQLAANKHNYDQNVSLSPGNLSLRQLIAQRYCMQGIPTDPDDIVITSGCLDALNLSLQAITQPGDYIVLQETTFYGAWQAAERLGLKVITVPNHSQFGFDINAFEQIVKTYRIKVCWFMLNAHNPVGFTVSDELKEKIAILIHQYQIYLIEDDVYEELYYVSKKPLPMKYFDRDNLVFHCSSFSKTLGAGFRIGWVYAGKYSDYIQHHQLMSTISANALTQNALVEFLKNHHYEKHLRSLRQLLSKNKRVYYHYLNKNLSKNCEVYNYPSGYFIWIKLPEYIESIEIYEELLKCKISVAPSHLFNLSEKDQNFLRINCSFQWSYSIQNALDTLIAVIKNR